MRVLLINPPSLRLAGFQWPCYPLGLEYIAAVLIKEGHIAKIYNADVGTVHGPAHSGYPALDKAKVLYREYSAALKDPSHHVWEEVEKVIRELSPGVVGITCKVFDMMSGLIVARIAKSVNRDIVVVLGGPAATTCKDMVLEDQNVDFAVRGEGEITMLELLKELQNSKPNPCAVDGLSFKGPAGIIHNKRRALIENISALPYPARDALLYTDMLSGWIFDSVMGHLITSRGCSYSCTFCANHAVWGSKKVRMRTAQDVVDEIIYLRDTYGIQRFVFWDDQFTINRQRTVAICNLLLEKEANVRWLCLVRADTIDEQLLRLMKKAGCYEVQVGVESGSDRILKKVKKGVTVEQIRNAAKIIRKTGLRWHAFLMIGFPGETREEMDATMRLISQLKPNCVELSVFTPYPGTPLYQELDKTGLLSDRDWLCADTLNVDWSYVTTMPRDEFRELALQYLKECDEYNNKMKSVSRYKYYARHPMLLARKVLVKLRNVTF